MNEPLSPPQETKDFDVTKGNGREGRIWRIWEGRGGFGKDLKTKLQKQKQIQPRFFKGISKITIFKM